MLPCHQPHPANCFLTRLISAKLNKLATSKCYLDHGSRIIRAPKATSSVIQHVEGGLALEVAPTDIVVIHKNQAVMEQGFLYEHLIRTGVVTPRGVSTIVPMKPGTV